MVRRAKYGGTGFLKLKDMTIELTTSQALEVKYLIDLALDKNLVRQQSVIDAAKYLAQSIECKAIDLFNEKEE